MAAEIPPIITAYTLRDLLVCERRVWLDRHGDPARRTAPPPILQALAVQGLRHEEMVQRALGPLTPIEVQSWTEAVAITRELMARGDPVIAGACLEQTVPLDLSGREFTLRGQVDRLVRDPEYGRPVYRPVEIKQRTRPQEADWIQLDFYSWLLELEQGVAPPAELWLGASMNGSPAYRFMHDFDEARLFALLDRAARLLKDANEPDLHLIGDCKLCGWRDLCRRAAEEQGSIDLLYNVPSATRDNLRAAGLHTLNQIVAQPPEVLRQIKGVGARRAMTIQANARAWIERRPVWLAALPESLREPGWMFDLETRELGGKTIPWCMGWCDVYGSTHIALVGPVALPEPFELPDGQQVTLVPDSDTAWEAFGAAIGADVPGGPPVYHWTGYEMGILRGSAPKRLQTQIAPRLADFHKIVCRVLTFPLGSTSIKAIAAYLGFDWGGYDDWQAAFQAYMTWRETGEIEALVRACAYQRADVQSMAHVWRWLMAQPVIVSDGQA